MEVEYARLVQHCRKYCDDDEHIKAHVQCIICDATLNHEASKYSYITYCIIYHL